MANSNGLRRSSRHLLCTVFCSALLLRPFHLQAAIYLGFGDSEASHRQNEYAKYNPYRQELLTQGIDAALYQLPLNAKELPHFHVLIYGGTEIAHVRNLDAAMRKRAAAERAALEQYVRAGGGLLILPVGRSYPGEAIDDYYNLVFAGFGARILPEGVWDPRDNFLGQETLAFPSMPFFMAANMRAHPVTAGVKRLALPQSHSLNTPPPGVAAMAYDRTWTIVAAGGPQAGSFKIDATLRLDIHQPGLYKTAPPIVAVRTFGKGRIVSYPLSLTYLSLNWKNPAWPHTVERQGNVAAREPSDSQRLVVNSIRWLAEPSQRLADFGLPLKPSSPPAPLPRSVQLRTSTLKTYQPKEPYQGILGAHTAFSDGQGTLEDYARAGTQAGLSFIIFTESLEHLSSQKWQTLVKGCQEVNRKGGIHLIPGYEYTDTNDCRWAVWGDQVIYPRPTMWARDGKRIFRTGDLAKACDFSARMLLTYDRLPGDPANLWWFYQIPLWVYDEAKLQADNLAQYLLAQENLFAVPTACFTRIRSPNGVPAAARRCTLNVERNRYALVRPALDTSLSQPTSWTYVSQGGSDGPKLEWVACDSAGVDVYRTRGTQRWRGAFVARSAAGLKEIRIYDGTSGLVRRYLCHNVKEFRQVLEISLDRQHYLVLEAEDVRGRRAVYSAQRLLFYTQGFYRCSDNLNLLGSTPTVAHPDRHEFPRFPVMEDRELLTLQGFDTGVGLFNQPAADPRSHALLTQAGRQGAYQVATTREDSGTRLVQVPMRVPFASYEINVAQADSNRYVKLLEPNVTLGPFLPQDQPLQYASVNRRAYLLRSRMDYPILWSLRRPHEGAESYRGDIFIHEGQIIFKEDVTLKGDLPIELETVTYRGGAAFGEALRVLVSDAEKGALLRTFGPTDRVDLSGELARGGYIGGQFTMGGTLAVVPAMNGMRYQVKTVSTGPKNLRWFYSVGLGRAGQSFKKGDTLGFRYLAVSISGRTPHDDRLLKGLGEGCGLAEKAERRPVRVEVGSEKGTEVVWSGQAQGHEFLAHLSAWPLLVNRPFRIEGIQSNGCAAVYLLAGPPSTGSFRFVGVFEGAALFQQNTDQAAVIWIGNPLYTDDRRLKLTLVLDGLGLGEKPFVEVHNPTNEAVDTILRSPPHTPVLGGLTKRISVPAGQSVHVLLPEAEAKRGQR